jgi:hypothetical protein
MFGLLSCVLSHSIPVCYGGSNPINVSEEGKFVQNKNMYGTVSSMSTSVRPFTLPFTRQNIHDEIRRNVSD